MELTNRIRMSLAFMKLAYNALWYDSFLFSVIVYNQFRVEGEELIHYVKLANGKKVDVT